MTNKKVFAIAIAALLVTGVAISIAFSQGYGRQEREFMPPDNPGYSPGRGYGMGMGFGRGFGYGNCLGYGPGMQNWASMGLDLTEEQLQNIQTLRTDFAKETIELHNKLKTKALDLQKLWISDELDENAILSKTNEISSLREELHEKRVQHHLDLAKVLTKEQRTQLLMGFGRKGMMGFGRRSHGFGRGYNRHGHRFGRGRGPRW